MDVEEPPFEVRVADGDPCELWLSGGLDVATVPTLRHHLGPAIEAAGPGGDLVVDVSALDFIDSTGLGAFVAASRRLRQAGGGSLVLRSPRQSFRYTLEVAGLTKVFVIEG